MSKTIRMGIVTEGAVIHDVFSYFRVMGPLPRLRKHLSEHEGINLELSVLQQGVWYAFRNLDVVYMHRPWNVTDLEILREAKKNGAKVWVDVDDNYFQLPNHFRHYYLYSKPDVRSTLKQIYLEADVLSVSTEDLRDQLLEEVGANAEVIPNTFPLAKLPEPDTHLKESANFSWRGTEETVRDLVKFAPEFVEFFKRFPQAKMHAWGIYPWPLVDAGVDARNIIHHGFKAFEVYYEELRALQPAFHLKLMDQHVFNKARSHCAWLEAYYAQSPLVAPNMREWQRPNAALYSEDKGSLADAMSSAFTAGIRERIAQLGMSHKLIKQALEVDVPDIRAEILKNILK